MPTVLRIAGFRFVIFTLDHEPAHVHAFEAGAEAIFNIASTVTLRTNLGMKRSSLAKAEALLTEHRAQLLEAWRTIHG